MVRAAYQEETCLIKKTSLQKKMLSMSLSIFKKAGGLPTKLKELTREQPKSSKAVLERIGGRPISWGTDWEKGRF